MVAPAQPRSYYGQPVLASPVWSKEIALYFWVGGLAGASAPLALVAGVRGDEQLARRAQAVALAGAVISPALLIKDLGQPKRFLHMLRVFKVTSPMSVGSWILSAFGVAVTAGAARELLGRMPRVGRAGQVVTLVLGPGLSTYTAALIANTAVPVWHDASGELPFLFAASSLASAGGAGVALTPVTHACAARRAAIAGGALELVLTELMERRLGVVVGRVYHEGRPQTLARGAKTLTALGAATVALRGRSRGYAIVGGSALLVGSLLERWAIFEAGTASAEDPEYTVAPQRERLVARNGRPTSYRRSSI
jgi:polysulfide reductase-like protein